MDFRHNLRYNKYKKEVRRCWFGKEAWIMSNEVYNIDQIKNRLLPVFTSYNINSAVLFGSYGKGIASEKSDIDLLVDSNLRGLKFIGLLEEIKEAMNKDVDLFDVSHVEKNSEIDNEIRETGVLIYEK